MKSLDAIKGDADTLANEVLPIKMEMQGGQDECLISDHTIHEALNAFTREKVPYLNTGDKWFGERWEVTRLHLRDMESKKIVWSSFYGVTISAKLKCSGKSVAFAGIKFPSQDVFCGFQHKPLKAWTRAAAPLALKDGELLPTTHPVTQLLMEHQTVFLEAPKGKTIGGTVTALELQADDRRSMGSTFVDICGGGAGGGHRSHAMWLGFGWLMGVVSTLVAKQCA